jgi:hypothetical protein
MFSLTAYYSPDIYQRATVIYRDQRFAGSLRFLSSTHVTLLHTATERVLLVFTKTWSNDKQMMVYCVTSDTSEPPLIDITDFDSQLSRTLDRADSIQLRDLHPNLERAYYG